MDSEENSFPSAFRYRAMEESEVVDSQMQDQNSEEHEDVEISENNEENLFSSGSPVQNNSPLSHNSEDVENQEEHVLNHDKLNKDDSVHQMDLNKNTCFQRIFSISKSKIKKRSISRKRIEEDKEDIEMAELPKWRKRTRELEKKKDVKKEEVKKQKNSKKKNKNAKKKKEKVKKEKDVLKTQIEKDLVWKTLFEKDRNLASHFENFICDKIEEDLLKDSTLKLNYFTLINNYNR